MKIKKKGVMEEGREGTWWKREEATAQSEPKIEKSNQRGKEAFDFSALLYNTELTIGVFF